MKHLKKYFILEIIFILFRFYSIIFGNGEEIIFIPPVHGYYNYTNGFQDPIGHNGLDQWGNGIKGATIVASADGIVRRAEKNSSYSGDGNFILIEHKVENKIYYTYYGHVNKNIVVNEGDKVKQGDKIGTVDCTGVYNVSTTCDHVHYQIYYIEVDDKGNPINLDKDGNPIKIYIDPKKELEGDSEKAKYCNACHSPGTILKFTKKPGSGGTGPGDFDSDFDTTLKNTHPDESFSVA